MTDHAAIHGLLGHGIPFGDILKWLETYGFPLVLSVLSKIPNGGLTGLTVGQVVLWISAALAAEKAGQPLPPLPQAA